MDKDRVILIADTETTGLGGKTGKDPIGLVEVAWIEVDENLEEVGRFDSLVNPEIEITAGASAIHNIFADTIADSPTAEQIEFPKEDVVLICHNLKFDYKLLAPHMNVVETCDSLILARRLLPDAPNHQLGTLAAYCGFEPRLHHRAHYDCLDLLDLMVYLSEGAEKALQWLIDWSHVPRPVCVMPWGKHAGTPMNKLPKGYLKWLKKIATDLDIDMAATVRRM